MKINKKIDRRKLLVTSAAFATTTAMGVLPGLAASADEIAADAFYKTGEFTFCDIKYLADMWGKSNGDAKVFAGQKIVDGAVAILKEQLTDARNIGLKKNMRCNYADADNPPYSYSDVEKLAKYWKTPNVGDAKLKIAAMLEQGMNLDIKSDLVLAQ